jgi:KDO2-lipid IV(A) lauroyltransferase
MAPRRAEQGRLNLQRVCTWLVANNMANDRVRRAAGDASALERMLRAAFRQTARYYLEVARASNIAPSALTDRLVIETPEVVEAAVDGGATILVGLHFGVVELPAAYFASRAGKPVTIPMETIDDPGLQAWFERSRGVAGVRIVGLREARRELRAALRRGELVGLVADRDITGGGIPVDFFGARASLPVGPGLLAIETGARVFVASVRRAERGRYRGRIEAVPVPVDGTRRERLTAFLEAEAGAFERAISVAPEQWWALFQPIWPDLVAGGPSNGSGPRGARRTRTAVGSAPDPEQPI